MVELPMTQKPSGSRASYSQIRYLMKRLNTALNKRLREGRPSKFCRVCREELCREHDPDESVEEDEEEEGKTEDEDENEEVEDEEEDDDETDDENDEEYDDDSDANVKKIRPWDMLMNITSDNMQDRFNEAVEKTLEEYPGTDIQKAEEVAYDKPKPKYLRHYIPLQVYV